MLDQVNQNKTTKNSWDGSALFHQISGFLDYVV